MTVSEDKYDELTNGSAKIFGMENFGNTCYCNSVLQCLYYSKPFREHMLAFPYQKLESPVAVPKVRANRPRRTSVPGSVPHPFTVNPTTATLNTSTGAPEINNAPIPPPGSSSSKEKKSGGLFGWGSSKDSDNSKGVSNDDEEAILNGGSDDEDDNNNSNNGKPTTGARHTESIADGLKPLPLGTRFPGQNLPVVGFTEDPFATQEARKRSALIKGPIINLDENKSTEYNMKESLFTALKDVFESMAENSSRTGVVSPAKLIEVLKRENELFRSSMHQDAHEFFNFVLNEVIENVDQYNRETGKASAGSWIHDLFEGLLTSETKCLTCENVSRRDEQFLDLSIDLERNSSITSCLQQFSASEMLCEGNKFHCDNCGGLQEAEKRMKVKKLPKILTLHLKRFKFTEDMQRNVKLFHRVLYPKHIRLMNTTYDAENPDKLYELCAIVVHIGGGPYHGHYVSVIKTEHCGWLLFDDEMVESVDSSYVFNFFGDNKGMATAYVLFYQEISESDLIAENLYENTDANANGAGALATPESSVSNGVVNVNGNGVANGHLGVTMSSPSSSSRSVSGREPVREPHVHPFKIDEQPPIPHVQTQSQPQPVVTPAIDIIPATKIASDPSISNGEVHNGSVSSGSINTTLNSSTSTNVTSQSQGSEKTGMGSMFKVRSNTSKTKSVPKPAVTNSNANANAGNSSIAEKEKEKKEAKPKKSRLFSISRKSRDK